MDVLNHDPRSITGIYAVLCLWMLGYPDRAVRLINENDAHARRRAHPFDLGFVRYLGTDLFIFRCEPAKIRTRAQEADRLGRDNSLPVLSAVLAPVAIGAAG